MPAAPVISSPWIVSFKRQGHHRSEATGASSILRQGTSSHIASMRSPYAKTDRLERGKVGSLLSSPSSLGFRRSWATPGTRFDSLKTLLIRAFLWLPSLPWCKKKGHQAYHIQNTRASLQPQIGFDFEESRRTSHRSCYHLQTHWKVPVRRPVKHHVHFPLLLS